MFYLLKARASFVVVQSICAIGHPLHFNFPYYLWHGIRGLCTLKKIIIKSVSDWVSAVPLCPSLKKPNVLSGFHEILKEKIAPTLKNLPIKVNKTFEDITHPNTCRAYKCSMIWKILKGAVLLSFIGNIINKLLLNPCQFHNRDKTKANWFSLISKFDLNSYSQFHNFCNISS